MYSQAVRVKKISCSEEDFEQHIHKMRSWFQKRTYPNKILDEELVKVRFSKQEKSYSKKDKYILFVATYHLILQALNNIIKRYLINWEYSDKEVKNLFSPEPMVSF